MIISNAWTIQERIQAASMLLDMIQADIHAERYGQPGRPNITSVKHLLHDDAKALETFRSSLEKMLFDSEVERLLTLTESSMLSTGELVEHDFEKRR